MLKKKYVMLVMYDLPMINSKEKKEADSFRKYLKRTGFSKIQKSVYVKLLRNYTNSEAEISKMKSRLPDTGVVNTLILRVEDFCKMQNLLGNAFDTDIFASDVILQ